jgi:hypothetical protein
MKFLKAEYFGPDSDGDINFDVEIEFNNTSDHEVETLKSSCIITNKDGIVIGGNNEDETEVFIEPGDSETFNIWTPYLKGFHFGGDLQDVNIIVDTTSYRCEFHKLGDHSIPESSEKPIFIQNGFDIGDMIKILGTSIFLEPIDEDGETGIEIKVGIRNVSEVHFDKVVLKAELLDKKGNEIEESSDYLSANAYSSKVLTASFWRMKPSRLKNCSVKLSLSINQPIGSETVNTLLKEGK